MKSYSDAERLIQQLEEYRKVTKATEDDMLVQLTYHVLQMGKHLANVEFSLGVLLQRETLGKEMSK